MIQGVKDQEKEWVADINKIEDFIKFICRMFELHICFAPMDYLGSLL